MCRGRRSCVLSGCRLLQTSTSQCLGGKSCGTRPSTATNINSCLAGHILVTHTHDSVGLLSWQARRPRTSVFSCQSLNSPQDAATPPDGELGERCCLHMREVASVSTRGSACNCAHTPTVPRLTNYYTTICQKLGGDLASTSTALTTHSKTGCS